MTTTTLIAALEAFKTCVSGVLSADPGGTAARIRSVYWGQGAPTDTGLPFLALQVLDILPTSGTDGGHEWTVQLKLRIVFDVSRIDKACDDVIRYLVQITNLLDVWLPADGIEGGEGFKWAPTLPADPSQGSMGYIEAEGTLLVRTTRGNN